MAQDNMNCDLDTTCKLLDKLLIKQLHLMEDKIQCELNIEHNINDGTIQLAKARYIMGHSSVSTTRLPTEYSPDFSASTLCKTIEEDEVKQLKLVDNNGENKVNPLRWFGVLVPQNLHRAQAIFQNTINFVVECVNIQLQIQKNMTDIETLQKYKTLIQSS